MTKLRDRARTRDSYRYQLSDRAEAFLNSKKLTLQKAQKKFLNTTISTQ